MQIPSYSLPSASVQRSTSLDNYNPKPPSMVSHSVSSKVECTETSINSNSSIFPSSNNKTPLITIPEDWATRDASQPRTIPLSKGSTKNRPKHDPQYISSLPNQSFHAIKSHYGRLDSSNNRQITQKRSSKISRSMSSSSSKSYRRQHQERKQEREHHVSNTSQRQYNESLETHSSVTERLHGTAAVDSQVDNKFNERSVSKKEDDEDDSDQRSDESDSDSSDSSDGSQSASRSHSDDESRQDDNASTDEEDSGSNASRSGSSSSCSSDGEDDSSSSSCASSQVIYFHRTKVNIYRAYLFVLWNLES